MPNPFPLSPERRREYEEWAEAQRKAHGHIANQIDLDTRRFDPKPDTPDRDKRGRFARKGKADGKEKAE